MNRIARLISVAALLALASPLVAGGSKVSSPLALARERGHEGMAELLRGHDGK
jgi:hypothetical protein